MPPETLGVLDAWDKVCYLLGACNTVLGRRRKRVVEDSVNKTCIVAKDAPPAVGPYSHAVSAGGFLYVSGMGPFTREGNVLEGSFEECVRLTFENLKAVLAAAGADLNHVVKTTVYLVDMNAFPELNRVYAEYFLADFPARTTLQAARLPKGIPVEIDAIALVKS